MFINNTSNTVENSYRDDGQMKKVKIKKKGKSINNNSSFKQFNNNMLNAA